MSAELKHYSFLVRISIVAIFALLIDFVTLCFLFRKSVTLHVYRDFRRYMYTRAAIRIMDDVLVVLGDIEKRQEKKL